MTRIDRPLRLGEIFKVTTELYRDRIAAALGIGGVMGAAFIAAALLPELAAIPILALALTLALALASRIAVADSFLEAGLWVARNVAVLAGLAVVVSLPFVIALSKLVFGVVFAVAWLALMGFSIPTAAVEREEGGRTIFQSLAFALERSLQLARAEYVHALGVIAALTIAYLVFGFLLGAALVGFAENGGLAAIALVQVILAPFFLLGLVVLYFEQKARALSSRGST